MPSVENTSLDRPVPPVLFPALTMSEPMRRGLRELSLYDNEGERKSKEEQSERGGGGGVMCF